MKIYFPLFLCCRLMRKFGATAKLKVFHLILYLIPCWPYMDFFFYSITTCYYCRRMSFERENQIQHMANEPPGRSEHVKEIFFKDSRWSILWRGYFRTLLSCQSVIQVSSVRELSTSVWERCAASISFKRLPHSCTHSGRVPNQRNLSKFNQPDIYI